MDILYVLALIVALGLFLKLYSYIWLILSSNRNKKQIELRIRSKKFDICNSKQNIRLSVTKSETIENGTKINHYNFYNATKLFEVHGPIQSLDTMYYESGIDNFIDCELYDSVIVFDGIEINSMSNLHKVMGLENNYVIVPQGFFNKYYIMDRLDSFCWHNKICFANELLWQDPCTKDELFALSQLEDILQNVFIVNGTSFSYAFLPLRYQSYFRWYRMHIGCPTGTPQNRRG